ncbi:MAG: hypothetical protein V7L04_15470 [Nostoc sp.]
MNVTKERSPFDSLYNYIFYIVREDAIQVVRILYATQDISSILDNEG